MRFIDTCLRHGPHGGRSARRRRHARGLQPGRAHRGDRRRTTVCRSGTSPAARFERASPDTALIDGLTFSRDGAHAVQRRVRLARSWSGISRATGGSGGRSRIRPFSARSSRASPAARPIPRQLRPEPGRPHARRRSRRRDGRPHRRPHPARGLDAACASGAPGVEPRLHAGRATARQRRARVRRRARPAHGPVGRPLDGVGSPFTPELQRRPADDGDRSGPVAELPCGRCAPAAVRSPARLRQARRAERGAQPGRADAGGGDELGRGHRRCRDDAAPVAARRLRDRRRPWCSSAATGACWPPGA